MMVMITSEEYKELILKEHELEELISINDKLLENTGKLGQELVKVKGELKELLLMLTDNHTRACMDKEFKTYDIADKEKIVSYINKNYLENDELKFRKVEEVNE